MRLASLLIALSFLSACATAVAPSTSSSSATTSVAAPPSRVQLLLSSAGRDDAATRAEIESALGQPDIARQDGAGSALTYRLPTCALLLLFVADGRNVQRLAEAHAGSRRPNDAAPTLQDCAEQAASR